MSKDYSEVTVVIPTLNEEKNIGLLIDILLQSYPNIHIVVTDDGSKDQTQEIVKNRSKINPHVGLLDRTHAPIHGLTASVLDAIKELSTRLFVVIDGDLQHPPSKIKEIVDQLWADYFVVIGIRVSVPDWKFSRRLMSWGASFLGRIALFMKHAPSSSDIMSGFFGANTRLIQYITRKHPNKFRLQGYKVLFEILKLCPRDLPIAEVPYTFDARKRGESKIGQTQILEYLWSIFV
ncbi:MAG: glycosyltransferase [Candidatus Hermodarchaeota archaeon]